MVETRLNRRSFTALVGVTATIGLAGCGDEDDEFETGEPGGPGEDGEPEGGEPEGGESI